VAVEIVASWAVLMDKARALGRARQRGSLQEIAKCLADLEAYEDVVRRADRVI
jgi:hypothetical protein